MYNTKKSLIGMLVVILGFTVFYLFRGDYSIAIAFEDNVFTVDGPQGTVFSCALADDDLQALAYIDSMDLGDTSAMDSRYGYVWGECENDLLGRYQLMGLKKLTNYIVIVKTDGSTLAFNMENAESTRNLYDSILSTAQKNGCSPATEIDPS